MWRCKMISGELKLEGITEISCGTYKWSDESIEEEITFQFAGGRVFAISGKEGFLKDIAIAILNSEHYEHDLGGK